MITWFQVSRVQAADTSGNSDGRQPSLQDMGQVTALKWGASTQGTQRPPGPAQKAASGRGQVPRIMGDRDPSAQTNGVQRLGSD